MSYTCALEQSEDHLLTWLAIRDGRGEVVAIFYDIKRGRSYFKELTGLSDG